MAVRLPSHLVKRHFCTMKEAMHRGDRGKMIHFFEIFLSCFYDWIYLIAFRCIINCQGEQLGRKKFWHKVTLVLETNHSKCVVSCIILPRAWGKMIQYMGQNDTIRLFSSQVQIFKTQHRNNYKHN